MRAHVTSLVVAIAVLAGLAGSSAAQLPGPFCLTEGDPAEAIALFIVGDSTQFLGTGNWLRRPVNAAGMVLDGSAHLSVSLPAFPPKGQPLSCGARIDLASGQGPLRCTRSTGVAIDRTLRGVPCVTPVPPADRMLIIGHDTPAARQVAALLATDGLLSHVNGAFVLGGTALFTVSAVNGPMPQTREALNLVAGDDASRAAIVLTEAALVDDQELLELVILEMRELLALYIGQAAADALVVLRSDAANFAALVRALPAASIALVVP